jgi:hypothetical protein
LDDRDSKRLAFLEQEGEVGITGSESLSSFGRDGCPEMICGSVIAFIDIATMVTI